MWNGYCYDLRMKKLLKRWIKKKAWKVAQKKLSLCQSSEGSDAQGFLGKELSAVKIRYNEINLCADISLQN